MAKKNTDRGVGIVGRLLYTIIGIIIVIFSLVWGANNLGMQVPTMIKGITEKRIDYFLDGARGISHTDEDETAKVNNATKNATNSWNIVGDNEENQNQLNATAYTPLNFTGSKQLVLGDYDNLGRATFAHIQLKDADEPMSGTREPRIDFDPVGWHNFKFKYVDENNETKEAWLMNRGHLVGYQFSGLNSEGKNLVPMTRYLNAGSISDRVMDDNNYNAMLFYENNLDDWLHDNQNYTLDYYVVPNYQDNELIPRTVTLYWTGFDENGNQIRIDFDTPGLEEYHDTVGTVTLKNISNNAQIDYLTGRATQK